MRRPAIILNILVVFLFSCKRYNVKITTISGRVLNLCTDSAISGVKVYLNDRLTYSDSEGKFSFDNVEVHRGKKCEYVLQTEGESGMGGGIYFYGSGWYIDNKNPEEFIELLVYPGYENFCYYFDYNESIVPPDSISIYFEQRTVMKNTPKSVYGIPNNSPTGRGVMCTNIAAPYRGIESTKSCTGTRYMGKWHITIEKKKSGVYSILRDSIYIPRNGVANYTIHW